MKRAWRAVRWLSMATGAGVVMQGATCAVDPEVQQALFDQLILPQLTNIVADTIFFFLDNAFVRLTV